MRRTTRTGDEGRQREEWSCYCRAAVLAGLDAGEGGQLKARRGGAGLVAAVVCGYQGRGKAWFSPAACTRHNMRRRKEKEKGKPRMERELDGD